MSQSGTRADRGLDLLHSDLNRAILRALALQPRTEGELKSWLVLRSPGKLRRHLATLHAAGAIDRRELRRLRRRVLYSLTDSGGGLVEVIGGVEHWLGHHPERNLEPVSLIGWRAFGVLAEAWEAGVIQLLALDSRDEAELSGATRLSPDKLVRDLQALEGAGVVAVAPGSADRAPRYRLSEWGARGVAALALSSHWERAVGEGPVPVSPEDAVAALLAVLPLVSPPESEAGVCTLTVEPDDDRRGTRRSAALRAEIAGGGVAVMPAAAGQSAPDAWLRGTIGDWLVATVEGRRSALHHGGRRELASYLVGELHRSFYGQDEKSSG